MISQEDINKLLHDSSFSVAKSSRESDSLFLPYAVHTLDTMGIASVIYNKNFSSFTRQWLMKTMDLDDELVEQIMLFLAGIHDIGKLQISFQQMICGNIDNYEIEENNWWIAKARELNNLKYDSHCNHTRVGAAILEQLKVGNNVIRQIVEDHHGRKKGKKSLKLLNNYAREIGGNSLEEISTIWKRVVEDIRNIAGLESYDLLEKVSWEVFFFLTGFIEVCDWIASNEKYFPLIESYSELEGWDENRRVKEGLKGVNIALPWTSNHFMMDDSDFSECFGGDMKPRPFQQAILDIGNYEENIGLVICEAPMGEGKTEAALALSDLLAAQCGSGGLFIGLPTQTNTNSMFSRIKSWSFHEAAMGEAQYSIRLANGKARFVDEYNKLRYPKDEENRLYIQKWADTSQLAMIPNFVVGTVDQLLMGALKYKGVFFRHVGLVGKIVIVDEVHMYDSYMQTYLKRILNWLGSYNIPVILLSATLSVDKRQSFFEAYIKGMQKDEYYEVNFPKQDTVYPKITYTSNYEIKTRYVTQTAMNLSVSVKHVPSDFNLAEFIQNKLSDGGCAAVIVNTVRKAQEIGSLLNEVLPADYVVQIFHAQFIQEDRTKIEKDILRRAGKDSTAKERKKYVVVSTQLLEVSLDLDFDLMISEMASADSLLQRMGRLHRHRLHDHIRPEQLQVPEFYIFDHQPDEWGKGTKEIYSRWLLWRTLKYLPKKVNVPQDIPAIVEKTYSQIFGEEMINQKAKEWHDDYERKNQSLEGQAKTFGLSPADLDFNVETAIEASMTDEDESGMQAVRNIRDTIEVILIKTDFEENIWFVSDLNNQDPMDMNEKLNDDQCRLFEKQKVRLPISVSKDLNSTISELEQSTMHYLKTMIIGTSLEGELFLLLDHNGKGGLGDSNMIYDSYYGLREQRKEKNERE